MCSHENILKKNVIERKYNECNGCNLGVFGNCSCESIDISREINFCDNCNSELFMCSSCNKYFVEKISNINNICVFCKDIIKKHNPSTNDEKYIFNDYLCGWYVSQRKKECKICQEKDFFEKNFNRFPNENEFICSKVCLLKELQNKISIYKLNNSCYEYTIKEDSYTYYKIYFRNKCICNIMTDWIDIFYLQHDYIKQCSKCNPSNNYKIYKYSGKCYNLDKVGKKCMKCDTILYKKIIGDKWGDVIQCQNHEPLSPYLKYKFIFSTGWKIIKYKTFNGKKHIWKNCVLQINNNYRCVCTKCNNCTNIL